MTNYIEQANQQQISIETKITPELLSDVPVNWVGGSRWTFDRGAMPGEPFAFLDGDNETSTAAMVEIQTPGRPVFFEVRKVDGILLSRSEFPDEAAREAERSIENERSLSNYTRQQLARICELDAAIDSAADQGGDVFFAAVAAKDEYIDSQGIDRNRLEVTGREVSQIETEDPALNIVEQVCKDFDGNGIYSVGAIGALRAMAHHWKDHLFEGHSPRIISEDIDEMKQLLEVMRAEIMSRIAAQQVPAESPRG